MDYFNALKQKITSFFDRDKEKFEVRPYREWSFIFGAFLLLILLVLLFGVWLFWAISTDRFFNGAMAAPPLSSRATLDKERLRAVLEKYEARRAFLEGRMQTPLIAPDPSL